MSKHMAREDEHFTPYIPNSASNPYLDQNSDAYEQNPYAQSSQASHGYVPPQNPYVNGPTTGAQGFTPERVRSQPPRGRFKTNGTNVEGMPGAVRKRRRRKPIIIVILLVLIAIAGVGAWWYFFPPYYNVTVDGVTRFVRMGTTLGDAVSEGFSTPTAGNLLAVDGSVYAEGEGEPFVATINGETTSDEGYIIPRNATVEFADGGDITEDYTETTQTIAHGTSDTDYASSNTYWQAPIHVYSAGEDGEESVKTGKQSGISVTEVIKEPVDEGYSVYNVETNQKVIALTFDDGPWGDTTDEILDILAENDAKATFFEIGNQCAEYPDNVKRIIAEGHQIGSHTYDHASGSGQGVNLTFMTADEQREEVEKGFKAIEDVAGTTVSRIMRAPGGNYYGDLITNLKDLITAEIGWNVDTEDWRKPGVESIKNAITSAKSGQVVLMHDGGGDRSQTVEALRQALPELKAEGYSFVTIDELLALNGKSDAESAETESSLSLADPADTTTQDTEATAEDVA